jgi:hypothetical protein
MVHTHTWYKLRWCYVHLNIGTSVTSLAINPDVSETGLCPRLQANPTERANLYQKTGPPLSPSKFHMRPQTEWRLWNVVFLTKGRRMENVQFRYRLLGGCNRKSTVTAMLTIYAASCKRFHHVCVCCWGLWLGRANIVACCWQHCVGMFLLKWKELQDERMRVRHPMRWILFYQFTKFFQPH